MLELTNISLLRTSKNYHSSSLKEFIINATLSPFSFFTQNKTTEYFLNNINLKVARQERLALIGRNGSGKTSLCRIIAQQLFPTSGQLNFDSQISFFSQIENSLFSDLTGYENLQFFIDFIFSNLDKKEKAAILEDCITLSGLQKKIDRRLETYSLGMISRLALSLIIVRPHDLLIIDEINNHADNEFKKKFSERLILTIAQSKSLILVSHNEQDLLANCTRGVVLEQGQILFDGPIEKAIACYKLLPTKDYV